MGILLLLALGPVDLAPGAPALQAESDRLETMLITAQSSQVASLRLQTRWTVFATPATPCADKGRVEIGWRTERFGAAWRQAVQAVLAQADRVRRLRAQPTVAPLIDQRWGEALDTLLASAATQRTAFLEASAWQAAFVRPVLAQCPMVPPQPTDGLEVLEAPVRNAPELPVAVLALGDGYVCPGLQRADSAVVLVRSGRACWSVTDDCACDIRPVYPGAVLGPEPEEPPPAAADTSIYVSPKSTGIAEDPEIQTLPPEALLPPGFLWTGSEPGGGLGDGLGPAGPASSEDQAEDGH